MSLTLVHTKMQRHNKWGKLCERPLCQNLRGRKMGGKLNIFIVKKKNYVSKLLKQLKVNSLRICFFYSS
jgi:hypothetical protein